MLIMTIFGSMMAVSAGTPADPNTYTMNGLLKSSSIDFSKDNTSVSILGGKIKINVGPVTYSNVGSALLGLTTAKIKLDIVSSKYKQIDYILVNGERARYTSSGYNNGYSPVGSISFGSESYNISDLSFKKQNNGYQYKISENLSLYELNNIQIFYKNQEDLKINKISKKGQYKVVTIKNIGDADAKASTMGIYIGKKKIKTVKVPAIKAGQSKNVKVKLASKYNKSKKTFKVDYNNKINEIYEDNNSKVAK